MQQMIRRVSAALTFGFVPVRDKVTTALGMIAFILLLFTGYTYAGSAGWADANGSYFLAASSILTGALFVMRYLPIVIIALLLIGVVLRYGI